MKKFITLFSILGSFAGSAQTIDAGMQIKTDVHAVLQLFNTQAIQALRFVDQPLAPVTIEQLNTVNADAHLFSKSDLASFDEQIKAYHAVTFDTSYVQHANFLARQQFESVFGTNRYEAYNPWDVYHEKFGDGYCQISYPVFNKKKNVCIFYAETSKDYTGGDGLIYIYKKKKHGWKLYKTNAVWSS